MSLWHPLERKLSFKSMLFKIYQVTFRSEKSGKTGQFEVMETNDWANVIPLTPEGKIILVKQFRFGSAELSLEFPAGIIENNEEPENAVKRELLEETGGMPTKVKLLGSCKPNPAFLQNTMYHYVAYGVVVHQEQQLDHFEEIEVITLSIEEVEEKILQGEINHSLSLVAWYFYRTLKA